MGTPGKGPHPEGPRQGLRGETRRQPSPRPSLDPLWGNSNSLMTPTVLRRQTSIKDLEDFASRAMSVNRAVGNSSTTERSKPGAIQVKRAAFSFDLSPPSLSNCGLMARRRRSKELFQRFCSIDEVEPDAFMRTIH